MINFFVPFKMIAASACVLLALFGFNYSAQSDEKSVFTKATIDLGIVVSDLDEVLFLDDEAEGLQYLLLVGQVLVAAPGAHRHAWRQRNLTVAGVDL